jgi:hypothetical protein
MVVQPIGQSVKLIVGEFAILDDRSADEQKLSGIVMAHEEEQLSLIDRTQENARQKLRDIVALAYDSLHNELKARFIVARSNAGELGVRFHEYEGLCDRRYP